MEKFYLVPTAMGENTTTTFSSTPPPPTALTLPSGVNTPIQELQKELALLNQDTSLADSEKWRKYENLFIRYFQTLKSGIHDFNFTASSTAGAGAAATGGPTSFTDSIATAFEGDVIFNRVRIQNLIATFPAGMRKKAELVLYLLSQLPEFDDKKKGNFKWSLRGELMQNGVPIVGSNIYDLIYHLLEQQQKKRGRKRKMDSEGNIPGGWGIFSDLLLKANLPQYLYGSYGTISRQFIPSSSSSKAVEEIPKVQEQPQHQQLQQEEMKTKIQKKKRASKSVSDIGEVESYSPVKTRSAAAIKRQLQKSSDYLQKQREGKLSAAGAAATVRQEGSGRKRRRRTSYNGGGGGANFKTIFWKT